MSGTRSALFIGCSDYADPEFPNLPAAARDIEALTRVLADPEIGDFTVEPLLNESSAMVKQKIEGFFADRMPDDLLVLYFSCHGVLDARKRLYFVATDTRRELLGSTGIPAQWIKQQMDDGRSRRIVLLLDCCYSGAFTRGPGRRDGDPEEIVEKLEGRGRVVITASDKTEYAYESEFTNAIVRGLQTGAADQNGDGQVEVCELYKYVHNQVCQNAAGQTPTMSADGIRGELYLARNPHAPSPLPGKLEQALTSATVWERRWAVDGLQLLLAGDHPGGQKITARKSLLHLRDEDTDEGVRAAAGRVLTELSQPPESPEDPRRDRRSVTVVVTVVLVILLSLTSLWFLNRAPPGVPLACSPTTKPADGVLSLGTLLPRTGQFIYSSLALDAGVRLAMTEINDAGGIPGIAVTLGQANEQDEGDPLADTGRQSARKLLTGGVDAIIGPSTSPVALKVIDDVVCAGVIMFAPANTSTVFTTYPDRGFYFRTAPTSMLEGKVLGDLIVSDGNATAVVMSRNDTFGNSLREMTESAIRESGGSVIDSFSYDPSVREYNEEVQRVKTKNPDAIMLIGFAENAQILAKLIEEGIGPRNKHVYLAGASTTNTLVAQVTGDKSVLAGLKGAPLDTGGEAFVERLRTANRGLQDQVYAAQAYDAVVITVLAAAIAGTDEPAAIAKEINGVTKDGEKCTSFAACMALVKAGKNIDYDGPSGPLEFTDPGEPSSATYVISEIQVDGTVKPLKSVRVP